MPGRKRGNKSQESKEVNLSALLDAYSAYLLLSKALFGAKEEQIYNVNELPASSPFVEPAKNVANELGVSWTKMSHEDSNRIMLALLEDYYNAMAKAAGTKNIMIQVQFKLKEK